MDLARGECLLEQCAGGVCSVCKGRVEPGRAVQLSALDNKIRHVGCDRPSRDRPPPCNPRVRRNGTRGRGLVNTKVVSDEHCGGHG